MNDSSSLSTTQVVKETPIKIQINDKYFGAGGFLKLLSNIFLTAGAAIIVSTFISILFSCLLYQLKILSGVYFSWVGLVVDVTMFSFFISSPAIFLFLFPDFLRDHGYEKIFDRYDIVDFEKNNGNI